MKKATMRLLELSADEKARQLYEARLKEQRDNYAREQGAVTAAIQSRDIEIVKNALQMKMSVEDIIKLTGRTFEEVESIRNEL
jgi:hypothetical protein